MATDEIKNTTLIIDWENSRVFQCYTAVQDFTKVVKQLEALSNHIHGTATESYIPLSDEASDNLSLFMQEAPDYIRVLSNRIDLANKEIQHGVFGETVIGNPMSGSGRAIEDRSEPNQVERLQETMGEVSSSIINLHQFDLFLIQDTNEGELIDNPTPYTSTEELFRTFYETFEGFSKHLTDIVTNLRLILVDIEPLDVMPESVPAVSEV